MKKNNKSGIILITTLIFMSLTFMLAVMICKNGKESLFAGNRYAENEQAYLSALSGIEFIKGQLSKDKDWLLSEDNITKYISSSSNSIKIEKNDNTITGYILINPTKSSVSNESYDSKFEIFLKNNSSKREYKSINNLFNNRDIINDENKRQIPAKSFYAYVKGTCGKTTRYAEALLISNGDTVCNGGNVINGAVNITSNNTSNNSIINDKEPEVYTKDNPFITIQDKNKNKYGKITATGELIFNCGNNNPSIILNSSNNTIINSNGIKIGNFTGKTTENEDAKHIQYDANPQISDELKNYSASNIDDKNFSSLPEGTYIFINDLDNYLNNKWVHINNNSTIINKDNIKNIIENLTQDEKQIIPCEGIEFVKKLNEPTEPDQIPTTYETRTVKITGNISSNYLKFILVDKDNTGYKLSDINTIDFSMLDNSIIKTTSDLYINGEVTGSGKIYCGGDLTMNAGSQLETKAQSGVAVYAEGNVNIKEAQNLSSDSSKMEDMIVEEAAKEAIDNLNISNETEIHINGRNISLDTITNSNTNDGVSISFQRTQYYGWGLKEGRHGRKYWHIDWFDLEKQGYNNINYTVTIDDTGSLSIYKNNEPLPIFTRTFDELKNQMYNYYDHNLKLHNSYDENKNSGNYCYNSYGIYQNGVALYDYNKIHSNDNYVGDMKLYIDDYLVGIIDINTNKFDNYCTSIKTMNISSKETLQGILFSDINYKGKQLTEQCFQNFTLPVCTITNTHTTTNSNITNEIITNTVQEYVNTYYKKQVSNTEIKGTVFSKNGKIIIDGNGGKFNIIGALMTANDDGNLIINNASHVSMIYDPDYVPFFADQGILTTTIFESVF